MVGSVTVTAASVVTETDTLGTTANDERRELLETKIN